MYYSMEYRTFNKVPSSIEDSSRKRIYKDFIIV